MYFPVMKCLRNILGFYQQQVLTQRIIVVKFTMNENLADFFQLPWDAGRKREISQLILMSGLFYVYNEDCRLRGLNFFKDL